MPSRPFTFIRHGQTDWNLEGRMQSYSDIPLNATGLAGARAAIPKLQNRGLTRIVSSPLIRAHQTATIIAEALHLPLETDPELVERSFGSYEGKLTAEMRALHNLAPEDSITKILPPDAEQWPQTLARSRSCVARLLLTYPDDSLLFVSHGAFFRALYEGLGGPRMEAKNTTPYHFEPATPAWKLTAL
jgi:broad specificity phosphatase PhoE